MEGISRALPSLQRAVKLQKKAAKVGFDWPDAGGVIAKVREELAETEAAMASGEHEAMAEEVGDLLFTVANLARKLKLDPEVLLASANAKFVQRFDAMEDRLSAEGRSLEAASADEMEAAWEAVKSAGSA
jgi:uncharacterized protein YabN with tetrapyrrole methylase and pyrophosphatase domain